MKREELKTLDLLCDMGIDVNGNRNLQPWKAYDIDEVNLVIKELESENEKLNAEIWKMASKQSGYEHFLRKENEKLKKEVADYHQLLCRHDALIDEHERLLSNNRTLANDKASYRSQLVEIRKENERLKAESEKNGKTEVK